MRIQDFKNLKDNYTLTQLKKIWPFVEPYKGRALLTLLLAIPLGSVNAIIAYSLKPFMDSVMIEKSADISAYVPIIIIVFSIIQALLIYAVNYLNSWVGFKITFGLKAAMYEKLLGFETMFYNKMISGDVFIRFSNDIDIACSNLLSQTKLFITRFFSSVSLIGVLFYHSWELAIVAIISLTLSLYPLKTYRKRIKVFNKDSVIESGLLLENYAHTILGQKVIALFNLKNMRMNIFNANIKRLFRLSMKMTQRTAFLPSLMTIVISFGIAIIIWYGSHLVLTADLTSGAFVSFIAALIMLLNPIKKIGTSFAILQTSLLAIERVFELYETEYQIKSPKNAKKLKAVTGTIEFNNVSFRYEEGTDVLKNISLVAKAGQTLALVGNSGGGKSTIASLITRLYDPQEGKILIDGKNTRDYSLESLRENISVVMQDNFLFRTSILDNITLGKKYSKEKIQAAIKAAYLEDLINSYDDGLNTLVGENGASVSGGQKQRIAIARAFLKDSPIVILDEATSALDNKSEKFVQEAMNKLMKNRTVIVIAHRLSTITNADNIIVVNNGKIAEEGTHKELLKNKDGIYTNLYSLIK